MTTESMLINEANRIAIHEVGHAVTALLLGRKLNGISLKPEPGSLGRAHYLPDPDWPNESTRLSQQQLREIAMISAGGIAAERFTLGWPVNDMQGASPDFIQMTIFAQRLFGYLSVADKNAVLLDETVELLARHRSLIVGLTEALWGQWNQQKSKKCPFLAI